MNSIQPVVLGDDRVFISSELQNGCALLRVSPPDSGSSSTHGAWRRCGKTRIWPPATPIRSRMARAFSACTTCKACSHAWTPTTGKVKWKGDRDGPGQLLLAGHHLLLVNGDSGEVALFETETPTCTELARYPLFNDKTWNTPALAGDQLFVRNQATIVCLQLPRQQ